MLRKLPSALVAAALLCALAARVHAAVPCTAHADCTREGHYCVDGLCRLMGNQAYMSCTDDSGCPSGICRDYLCQDVVAPCATHEDCGEHLTGAVCYEGLCMMAKWPEGPCETEADCSSATSVCQYGTCWYVEPPLCSETSLPCPTGLDCVADRCTYTDVACTAPQHCAEREECVDGACVAAPGGCETDDECEDGERCEDGACVVAPVPTDECAADADCAAGEICLWARCVAAADGFCRADDGCGAGEVCIGCVCEPAAGTCRGDADCEGHEKCLAQAAEPPEGGDPACVWTRGFCVIDPAEVETDTRCQGFCEAMVACLAEDAGTAPADPMADCIGFCSFLAADPDGEGAIADLVGCVAAATPDCARIRSECTDAAKTAAAAGVDDVIDVAPGEVPPAGSSGAAAADAASPHRRTVADAVGDYFGFEADQLDLAGLLQRDGGGSCAAGGAGAGAAVGLCLIALLAVVRRLGARRRRAG